MAITFGSVGHAFASAAKTVYTGIKAVEQFVAKVATDQKDQQIVESLTALVPGIGTQAVAIERVAFAALGELGGVLAKADAAAEAKLLDAGLDKEVIASVKQFISDNKAALASAGVKF